MRFLKRNILRLKFIIMIFFQVVGLLQVVIEVFDYQYYYWLKLKDGGLIIFL